MKGNARGSGYARNADDYYCEPRVAVDALLDVEEFADSTTWDPACGSGNIPRAFRARGYGINGTDLVDRGGCDWTMDFLAEHPADYLYSNIVTNPPFNLATEFLLRALPLTTDKVCILQRLAWLEGKARRQVFESTPLARVWVFSSRISMPPGGSNQPAKGGSVAFAWYVWKHGHQGPPTLGWIP